MPTGYAELLADLKQRIQTAQLRASLSVNRELVLLYWGIGREILPGRSRMDGEPGSSNGWRVIYDRPFPACRDFRRAISAI